MQKIHIFFSYLLLFIVLIGVFFPFFSSFSLEDTYDYSEYTEKINISPVNIWSQVFEKKLSFLTPRTTFSLWFPWYSADSSGDVRVEWIIDGKIYMRTLDIEEGDDISDPTTFPLVTDARSDIYVRISSSSHLPSDMILTTSRHDALGSHIVFRPQISPVSAADGSMHIISRKEWWADESLRYVSSASQEVRMSLWIARGKSPLIIEQTAIEQAQIEQDNREISQIRSSDIDASASYSLTRYDGDNKLIWPITKTKKVNKIMIHHTAESLDQDADDATLMRAIYAYHAHKWGDIGYNYVIGQRWAIYEWRAGWDYTEWAHVYGNNQGSIGISMIGNYETLTVNKDQKAGLIEAVEYVTRKYGISLDTQVIGAHLCPKWEVCRWKSVENSSLAAHRDYANTSCSGKNLYALLPEIRTLVASRIGSISPVLNQSPKVIDPVDPEDEVSYVLKSPQLSLTLAITQIPQKIKSSWGKSIKIKLSYPNNDTIDLLRWGAKIPLLRLDNKKILINKDAIVSVWKVWDNKISLKVGQKSYEGSILSFSSDLVSIPSWSRIPSWDVTRRYNDNIFRSRIVVRNDLGNLLIVNELPIEDYLKWLGEVSNSDLPEKIKTIIIWARTYAYYYRDRFHRKYNTLLYDGSDNPDEFQKYLGYGYELRSPDVARYVDDTKWEVITYNDELIKSWYFSSSDGKTRSYKEYCESNGGKTCTDIPYLQSVDDPAGVWYTRSGHGVGISGIGATYAASLGKTYREIIPYYLTWVELKNINILK